MRIRHGIARMAGGWGGIVLLASSLSGQCLSQQQAAAPRKAPTPEQLALQQKNRDWVANRQRLQEEGKQLLAAETARESAGDCPSAGNTVQFNECFGRQLETTDKSLEGYERVIRALMAPEFPEQDSGRPQAPGPAGATLTPAQLGAEFDHLEALWRDYRKTACTAAFHQFGGGTGGPSFELQCEIKLARNHMRELDLIYGEDLHL